MLLEYGPYTWRRCLGSSNSTYTRFEYNVMALSAVSQTSFPKNFRVPFAHAQFHHKTISFRISRSRHRCPAFALRRSNASWTSHREVASIYASTSPKPSSDTPSTHLMPSAAGTSRLPSWSHSARTRTPVQANRSCICRECTRQRYWSTSRRPTSVCRTTSSF
jgi:hypothetical protein